MIIDIEKAKEEFLKYTEKYDLEDINIKRKQIHSLRVMEISRKIAEGLNLSQEEIKIAELIGLLHDISRFEQYTKYHTFRDANSIDHGDFAVQILEKDIRKYIKTNKYDNVIKTAIKNHNKYKIEEGINDKEELFAKIIRDADKLDILYIIFTELYKGKEKEIGKEKISEEDIRDFRNLRLVEKRKDKNNELYDMIVMISFIFDINFKMSFKIIKEQDSINRILNQFNFEDENTRILMEEIRTIANNYIEQKIKQ